MVKEIYQDEIAKLLNDISQNVNDVQRFLQTTEGKRILKKVNNTESKSNFYNQENIEIALQALFAEDYNLKDIAKKCYTYDEDEFFSEELDFDFPLGLKRYRRGECESKRESSTVKFIFKPLAWGRRHRITGMPFSIISMELV